MLASAKFNVDRMHQVSKDGFSTATDLAEHLVRQGVPFRSAHEQVGKLVAWCIENGRELSDLTIDEIRRFAPEAAEDIVSQLTVEASVAARSSYGGTAPSEVKRQIEKAKRILAGET
ncbi:MAG: argininosuccinate lyase, partial [Armatimonadota bacterium]